mgnify:FL=1|jgi:hypothetical protein
MIPLVDMESLKVRAKKKITYQIKGLLNGFRFKVEQHRFFSFEYYIRASDFSSPPPIWEFKAFENSSKTEKGELFFLIGKVIQKLPIPRLFPSTAKDSFCHMFSVKRFSNRNESPDRHLAYLPQG